MALAGHQEPVLLPMGATFPAQPGHSQSDPGQHHQAQLQNTAQAAVWGPMGAGGHAATATTFCSSDHVPMARGSAPELAASSP